MGQSVKILTILFIAYFFLASIFCLATDEKIVYIQMGEFPSVMRVLKSEQAELEKSITALDENRKKWKSYENAKISYVVEQKVVSVLDQDPCISLPILVSLNSGRLVSAIYNASGGNCKKGGVVSKSLIYKNGLLILRTEFFGRVEKSKGQLNCYLKTGHDCLPSSLSVVYDREYGIPIEMVDGSALVMDGGWSLKISDLNVLK